MEDPDNLNPLSCCRCRMRKVKCNRVIPKCSRCEARGVDCVYPRPGKRTSARRLSNHVVMRNMQNPLAIIFERLQHVEDRSSSLTRLQLPNVTGLASPERNYLPVDHPMQANPTSSPAFEPFSNPNTVGSNSPSESQQHGCGQGDFNPASILEYAIHDVGKGLHRMAKSVIAGPIDIPSHRART
ncbi:hypothetical protein BJY01DRAFT_38169 [Aspergillus pseudoustus]|uniref:Zn(2)-C6 fungal-type domain-containing protein n=1 Tax=Aspergillus pseudoustus TaxID=1810923 RepID=A0ABR4JDH5_9EURO